MAKEKDFVQIFKKIQELKYGAKFYKADLHFHTPASEDARGKNRYNFNPYKVKYPTKKKGSDYRKEADQIQKKILADAHKIASDIVRRFIEVNLSVVAVTDHNGIGTIWNDDEADKRLMDLAAPTWYELIDDEAQKVNDNAGKRILTILPGTEISTTGIHILAVFPPQNPRRKIHFIICDLLNEVGFAIDDWGRNPKVGTASPFDTISLIAKKGGIPILAHIDGSDQAILKLHKINSGAMKNVLLHKQLSAVEIVNPPRFTKKDSALKKPLKDWMDEIRLEAGLSTLSFFQGSDAHDIPTIAKRHTYIKMTEPSFSGFKTAIKMPSSRVRISGEDTSGFEGLYIHSFGMNNPFFEKQIFRFNRHANCVTGNKGAGKSYIFDLMQAVVDPTKSNPEGETVLFLEKIKNGTSKFYAFSRSEGKDSMELYAIEKETSSIRKIGVESIDDLNIKPKFYNPERMGEIISSKEELNSFLIKYFGEPSTNNVNHFNNAFSIPGFLKKRNTPLFVLQSKQGKYSLFVNTQWHTGKTKMANFFALNKSLRRIALICGIIIVGKFGPVIIDAPEEHFDNGDIADFLVPIIKKYKDFRQVILFTNNPLLAVNTDPDNYILLKAQGEKFKNLVSGFAVDDKQQRPELLNIMEGNLHYFNKRAERYESSDGL